MDVTSFDVNSSTTVKDLKLKSIKKKFTESQHSKMGHRYIFGLNMLMLRDKLDGAEYNSNVKSVKLNSTLVALLDDPILSDVPRKPSLSNVDTLISLELGSAMRISVLKIDGTSFDVPVMNSSTVKDLKLGIRKKVNESEQSKMGHRHISWKHVWGNFCLSYHNEKLLDDDVGLQDYGIRNNSQVDFISYVMSRSSRRHSRRKKHRFFHGLNKRFMDQ